MQEAQARNVGTKGSFSKTRQSFQWDDMSLAVTPEGVGYGESRLVRGSPRRVFDVWRGRCEKTGKGTTFNAIFTRTVLTGRFAGAVFTSGRAHRLARYFGLWYNEIRTGI